MNLRKRGGKAQSLTYTGYVTDDLSISTMVGEIEPQYASEKPGVDQNCPSVNDARTSGATEIVGCGQDGTIGADIEYVYGNHTFKVGLDVQERASTRDSAPVGGHDYTYNTLIPTGSIQGIPFTNNTDASIDYVTDRIFAGGGGFKSDLTAFYIEDTWLATDNLVLNIGLRKDKFEGEGTTGKVLFDFDTDIAPRLGFSWDINGDGESKLFDTFAQKDIFVAEEANPFSR
ncbi:MAG: hypothetical protein ACJAVV_002914 [Alphaproteobacteria bacterium]